MSTITVKMSIPVSKGNASAAARQETESQITQFGEILKTQSRQNQENPDKEQETGDQGRPPVNKAFVRSKGILQNWQMMNLLLLPGMPMQQIISENVNIAAAEDGEKKLDTMETLPAAPDITGSNAGETKQEVKVPGQADVVKVSGAADAEVPETEAKESDMDAFNIELKQAGNKAEVTELTKDVQIGQTRQPLLKNGQQKTEGISGQKMPEESSTSVKGMFSKENTGLEKEPDADKNKSGHLIQETGIHDNAAGTTPVYTSKAEEQLKPQKTDISPEYIKQLKSNIADSLAAGKREFEIQLNPANLGKLVIKASYEAGRAVISIVCSEAKTMETMSQQARELAGMVEDRTGSHTIVVVEPPAFDYLEQQGNKQQGGRQEGRSDQGRHGDKEQKHHENLDFQQQLRLGLV